jgi:hypothetical protein
VGWTKCPYVNRSNFKILVGKPFEKRLEEREEMEDYFGILILRVAVWWKCSVDPGTRADRLLGCTTRISVI